MDPEDWSSSVNGNEDPDFLFDEDSPNSDIPLNNNSSDYQTLVPALSPPQISHPYASTYRYLPQANYPHHFMTRSPYPPLVRQQNRNIQVLTPANSSTPPDMDWPLPLPYKANTTGEDGITPWVNMKRCPTAREVLDNPEQHQKTYFRDATMAADFRASLGDSQAHDPTIPTTPEQKRACVLLLFKAFKSVVNATDNPHMQQKFIDQYHNNYRVEAMCWDLLAAVIRRSEIGPLVKAYDEKKVVQGSITYFADRMDAVVGALLEQKTICKHLLDAPYINIFVDDPTRASGRVKSNRELNKKKSVVMSKGKAELEKEASPQTPKRKRAKNIEPDSEFEDEEDPRASSTYTDSTYIPSSRQRSARRSGRVSARKARYTLEPTRPKSYASSPLEQSSYNVQFTGNTLPRPLINMHTSRDAGSSQQVLTMSDPDFHFAMRTNSSFDPFHSNMATTKPFHLGNHSGYYAGDGAYLNPQNYNQTMAPPNHSTSFPHTQAVDYNYNTRMAPSNDDNYPNSGYAENGSRGGMSHTTFNNEVASDAKNFVEGEDDESTAQQ